jgi:protein-tyrosine-phosphatase/predicted ATP-grasp superfamily ATP-dependent carboligase
MRRRSTALRILVTDAQTPAGLGAVRSLGRAGHRVIAAYPDDLPRPASTRSRYCAGRIRYPSPRLGNFAFREWLRDQAKRGELDAVWPVAESAIVGVASVRDQLPKDLLLVLPGDVALTYTLSKFQSTRVALSLGLPCPRTVFVSDATPPEKWSRDLSSLRFPVVIKTDNHLTSGGTYEKGHTFVAATPDAACRVLEDLEHLGTRIIAQEWIPGTGAGAFLLVFGGKMHLAFAHRRLHEVPYTGGLSSFRESCHDDDLIALARTILDHIGYEGVAMVEFRRGADRRPHFLEINGRLWGSLALALHCGIDFPAALIDCYQNGAPAREGPPYRAGVRCRNIFPGELGHLLSIFQIRSTPAATFRPSRGGAIGKFLWLCLDPTIRHDYFWWSDPVPGVIHSISTSADLAAKLLKGAWRVLLRRRDDRMLDRLRREHAARRTRPRYFAHPVMRVMFLCYGNICRSAFAAQYWNARVRGLSPAAPLALSAGFHPQSGRSTPGLMAQAAIAHAVDLTTHRSRVVTREDVESVDAILVMDRSNYRDLLSLFPWARPKTYLLRLFAEDGHLEIADPNGKGMADVRICCNHLVASVDGLIKRVLRDAADPA